MSFVFFSPLEQSRLIGPLEKQFFPPSPPTPSFLWSRALVQPRPHRRGGSDMSWSSIIFDTSISGAGDCGCQLASWTSADPVPGGGGWGWGGGEISYTHVPPASAEPRSPPLSPPPLPSLSPPPPHSTLPPVPSSPITSSRFLLGYAKLVFSTK